jgi:serine/threonine protein kinase
VCVFSSYGAVYKALDKRDGQIVAIKILEIDAEDTANLQREIHILRECDCDYIVRYKGAFRKENHIWIVMEYCGAGSVCDLMAICERTLSEEQIATICKQSLLGLAYLHEKHKIHRDIKSGNLLLTHNGDVKLADFGVSAELTSTMSKRKTVIGT